MHAEFRILRTSTEIPKHWRPKVKQITAVRITVANVQPG